MAIDREINRRLLILAVVQSVGADGWGAEEEAVRERLADLGGDPSQLDHSELQELARRGWVSTKDMSFGDWIGAVTPAGRDAAARIEQDRANVAARRIALRDVLLRWLYDRIHVHDALMPDPKGVPQSGATYFGVVFTDTDVEKASAALRDAGYIRGTTLASGEITLVELLPKGVRLIERGGSVRDDEATSGTTITTTVHGPANIANQSSSVSQSIDLSSTWLVKAAETLDGIEQALPALGLADEHEVSDAIADARGGVATEDPSRTKSALERLLPFLSATTAGALGNLVSSGVVTLLGLIP